MQLLISWSVPVVPVRLKTRWRAGSSSPRYLPFMCRHRLDEGRLMLQDADNVIIVDAFEVDSRYATIHP